MPCAGVSLGPGGAVQVILAVCGGLWAQPGEGTSGGDGATEHHGRAMGLAAMGTLRLLTQPAATPAPCQCEAVDIGTPGDISGGLA